MWSFRPTDKQEQNQGSKLDEFFNSQDITTSLVRESLQNSLDAKLSTSNLIRVKFSIQNTPKNVIKKYCKTYDTDEDGIDLSQHLASEDLGKYKLNINEEKTRCLLVEDYGTCGLTGIVDKSDAWAQSNFVGFWWNVGISNKPSANGSHGVGKTTLTSSSSALTFLALTKRSDDDRKYLIGFSNLPPHRIKNKYYRGYGRFGREDEESNLLPIDDKQEIYNFETSFGIQRNEPGLTVLIPWVSNDITPKAIETAVLTDYYWPVLNGQLVIEIEDFIEETSILIDKKSIKELASTQDNNIAALIEFASESIELRNVSGNPNYFAGIDVKQIKGPKNKIDGQITEECFTESNLEIAREAFKNGEIVGFGLCLPIQKSTIGEKPRTTTFDVFLQRNEETKNIKLDQFIRKQIVISREKSGIAYPFSFAILVAEDKDISDYLKIAEEPAHNNWHFKRFRDEKIYTSEWQLRFIKHYAMKNLFTLLSGLNDEDTIIDDFADHIFKIFEPSAGETSGQKQKQPKSKETGQNPKPKPKPEVRNPALIAIDQKSDENGFRIHPTSHLKEALIQSSDVLPFVIKVKTAYAVLKGRNASFNQYSKLDFDLSKNEGVTVEALKGANIISLDQNIIEAEINSLDFTIEAKGFDKVRDLLVKVST